MARARGLPLNRRSALGLFIVGLGFFGYVQLTQPRPSGPSGEVTVPIVSSAEDAAALTAALADRGAGITVRAVPVSPQLVGTWVSLSSDGHMDERLYEAISDEAIGHVVTLTLPARTEGLELSVGVTPRPGEQPEVEGLRNAFAPQRVLECSRARGDTAAAASRELTGDGYAVSFARFPDLSRPVEPGPDDIVTMAFVADDAQRQVTLAVLPRGDPGVQAQLDQGFAPSQLADGDACNDLP